jgi:DNA-binding transcriptional ArsR family regulator
MARTSARSDIFSAIAEPRRRQIIELLSQRPSLAVGAIVLALGVRQPDVSKHLGVLRQLGVVSVSKQGQHRVYDLNPEQLKPISEWVKSFERHWEHQLDRIQARAERRAAELARNRHPSSDTKGTT